MLSLEFWLVSKANVSLLRDDSLANNFWIKHWLSLNETYSSAESVLSKHLVTNLAWLSASEGPFLQQCWTPFLPLLVVSSTFYKSLPPVIDFKSNSCKQEPPIKLPNIPQYPNPEYHIHEYEDTITTLPSKRSLSRCSRRVQPNYIKVSNFPKLIEIFFFHKLSRQASISHCALEKETGVVFCGGYEMISSMCHLRMMKMSNCFAFSTV